MIMSKNAGLYREFVNGMARHCDALMTLRAEEGIWQADIDEEDHQLTDTVETLMEIVPPENWDMLKVLARKAYLAGYSDCVFLLSADMSLGKTRVEVDGIMLPVEPYERDLVKDWEARLRGDDWRDTLDAAEEKPKSFVAVRQEVERKVEGRRKRREEARSARSRR